MDFASRYWLQRLGLELATTIVLFADIELTTNLVMLLYTQYQGFECIWPS
jgi:hypothetical protein